MKQYKECDEAIYFFYLIIVVNRFIRKRTKDKSDKTKKNPGKIFFWFMFLN